MDYQFSRDPSWTRAVYEAIATAKISVLVRDDSDATTVTVSGPCPNCAHPFTDTDTLKGSVDIGRVTFTVPGEPEPLPPATLHCTCREPHPGRPATVATGCGIHFLVFATRTGQSS
ncbi:hypothetical protein [Nocardia jiangsuensis]|uniref:Uncharacterized protein n=1 Tax=Nocardia jiangsuensis TaxID=1691563 RepID=A0ABV8E223_9NOCA